ncbi:hypothetical protein [Enterococcus rivorum]|uniref:Cobalamin adenosyltransferase-like domain-containing protein n=1 Tax=Enterococcus rivorum TaxID=762845 RepID=A0A1E5KSK8_9ENTE|nr:hypothetical protein [Enterococcus rivorum]MBP2098229.1 hypothetical protein [Enterococcus rivorum]OEH80850.1 hypothetical protein BCR26_06365 [Enterococcus rivorum]
MRFITEMELKVQYRKAPFSSYKLPSETRLTPEARQFLVDRKIDVKQMEQGNKSKVEPQNQEGISNEQAITSFQKTLSFFLLSFSFLLEKDVLLAEKVLCWQRHLEDVKKAWQQGKQIPTFQDNRVSIEEANLENIEISAFHIQLPYGRELAILNCLNTSLIELSLFLNEGSIGCNKEEQAENNVQTEVEQVRRALLMVMTQMIRSERQ